MNDTNYHVSYPDVYRYWSKNCEQYAGCDSLLTALRQGWQANEICYSEDHWLAGMRLVVVFHFELRRGSETIQMPVISNPFVRRLIYQEAFQVRPMTERSPQARRQRDQDIA
jgi:hypothetical protein